jgi:3-isopropylmalate dehydrogenase
MLRHAFGEEAAARAVEGAVSAAISAGARTADIASKGAPALGTAAFGDAVLAALR